MIGAGGMGEVWLAEDNRLKRRVAIKVLPPEFATDPERLARFEQEARAAAALNHPNIAAVFDVGNEGDTHYFVQEYLRGATLRGRLEQGTLSLERSLEIATGVARALSASHRVGIVHRDLKPENIFLTEEGDAKVLDFGLAKQITAEEAVSLTGTGVALGTPRYISPEAIKGAELIDARSDIYCLGAVAYFMLTGRPPFDATSSAELMIDHLKATPAPPSQVSELPIPAEFDEIVLKCLEKKPEDRYPSAAALESALRTMPDEGPWSQEKARAWWSLHGLATETPPAFEEPGPDEKGLSNRGVSRFIYEP